MAIFAGLLYDWLRGMNRCTLCFVSLTQGTDNLLLSIVNKRVVSASSQCSEGVLLLLHRVGPVLTLLVGVALHFLGYFGLWWAARGIFQPPYWVLVIIAFFTCNAQTFMETGAMVTSIRNFDTER